MVNLCQFCNLANGREYTNIIYQTNLVCCFLDINPISEGHSLIVPKKHILDIEETDQATRLDLMNTAALISKALKIHYSPDGISMIQNGGYFSDVNHYHLHLFPRYKHDGFGWIEPKSANQRQTTPLQVATHLQKIVATCLRLLT